MRQKELEILAAMTTHLRAASALADVLLVTAMEDGPVSQDECEHENKILMPTFGRDRWICRDCGFTHDEPVAETTEEPGS